MRKIALVVAGLLCSLLGSLLLVSPGAAAVERPTLDAAVHISSTEARFTGTAPMVLREVKLQQKVAGRWVSVAVVPVSSGSFETVVTRTTSREAYRVLAGWFVTGFRYVEPAESEPTPQPPPSPEPTPEPEPDPEPTPEPEPSPELPPVEADACGVALVGADGSRRVCTFADDFDGVELDRSKWVPQTILMTGDEDGDYACYRDHPDNVSVSGGALQLTLRKEESPQPCAQRGLAPTEFTSGSVMTYHLFSQRYGRFEARMRNTATTARGLHEAFWLWPDDRQDIPVLWPEAGEIDIAETYSQHPSLVVPFLHYTAYDNWGPRPGLNTAWDCVAARGEWNTYALEWTPSRLEIFVNGRSCLVNTSGDPAFQRKYIVVLTQLLGTGANAYVDGHTPVPATTSVDYVRVWQ